MADLSGWDFANEFNSLEAASLIVGIDPIVELNDRWPRTKPVVNGGQEARLFGGEAAIEEPERVAPHRICRQPAAARNRHRGERRPHRRVLFTSSSFRSSGP